LSEVTACDTLSFLFPNFGLSLSLFPYFVVFSLLTSSAIADSFIPGVSILSSSVVRGNFGITVPDDGNCIGYSWYIVAAYHRIEIFRYAAVSANAELGHPKIGSGTFNFSEKKHTWICVTKCSHIHKSTLVLWDANEGSELDG
jgi:hypothetical protein